MIIFEPDRYISTHEFVSNLETAMSDVTDIDDLKESVEYALSNTPSADVDTIEHSHWLYDTHTRGFYCVGCMRYLPNSVDSFDIVGFEWCPFCGKKMDEFN